MKITTLELKAFGPFTDKTLDFHSDDPGLHIIFGPNEAGKSSSLRGLKVLLYGFPERTSDNFLHPNDQLRVGGTLQGQDGQEFSFLRRKKRKADILDSQGNPLDQSILIPFLHNIDAAVFDTLYGINHDVLVQGGEDILAQKGEVGQALFAAGAGLSSLRKILASLDAEGNGLFKPRGSKQHINTALAEYKRLQKQIREASLSGRQWEEHHNAFRKAEEERTEIEKAHRLKESRIRHLKRLQRALPLLSLLKKHRHQLSSMGTALVLPDDFSRRRRTIEQEQHSTLLQRSEASTRLKNLKEKHLKISLNNPLLDQAESIEELYQRLGGYRKAMDDRPKLDGMRIANRTEAADLLRRIRPDLSLDDIETMRLAVSKKIIIQNMTRRYDAILQKSKQAEKQYQSVHHDLKATQDLLEKTTEPCEDNNLSQAVKLARKSGDIDAFISAMYSDQKEAEHRFSTDLQRLGLWSGSLEEVSGLQVPLTETVTRFAGLFHTLDEQKRDLVKDKNRTLEKLKQVEQQILDIQYEHQVPTEQELEQKRDIRDKGWQLIRRSWLDGEDISTEGSDFHVTLPLPDAYEKTVHEADNTADRLRREADRVHLFASLQAEKNSLSSLLKDLAEAESSLADKRQTLLAEWLAVWQPSAIEPLSPGEMLAWLGNFENLRFHADEIQKMQRGLAVKEKQRQILRQSLIIELKSTGIKIRSGSKELDPFLAQADSVLNDLAMLRDQRDKLKEKKRSLEKERLKAQEEKNGAEQDNKQWNSQWKEAVQPLGLSRAISPDEAEDILETLQLCFNKGKEADVLLKRIEGIDKDASVFSRKVETLTTRLAPELGKLSSTQAVVRLQAMLTKNREDKVLYGRQREEINATVAEIQNADSRLEGLNEQLAHLLSIAGCAKSEELDEAERKSKEWLELSSKISDVEANLSLIAEGLPLEELEAHTEGINPDTLPGEIDRLSLEIEQSLTPEIKRLSQIIGEENKELERMDGRAQAADAAEEAQNTLAQIRRLADSYVRVRLAATILKQEIERFRAENQDPILAIASHLFSQLTLTSFSGLRTDVDDQGTPVLIGERNDGSRISVEKMSSGTRDQLYLALRLASLEWRLESSGPMPFIVDDILINFDDDRARVTLQVLADLAAKTQVILFSHHRQIVEASSSITGKGSIHLHEL
jgi:uncharacterized protein YhaN